MGFLFLLFILGGCGSPTPGDKTPTRDGIEAKSRFGEPVERALFPAIAPLKVRTSAGKVKTCTASFIDDNVAITAAHCLSEMGARPEILVSLLTGSVIPDFAISHPSFTEATSEYNMGEETFYSSSADLILLRFRSPVSVTPMSWGSSVQDPLSGDWRALGYGVDELELGQGMLRLASLRFSGFLPSGDIGLVPSDTDQIPCRGDDGGPLLRGSEIVGVASRIRYGRLGQCASARNVTFVSLATHHDWIRETLENVDNPWRNPVEPLDIDRDGSVTSQDASLLIDDLEANGARILGPEIPFLPDYYPDVNGDRKLTPIDVQFIIARLNEV